ncbi:hypothetical protein GCM10010168_86250 [Actinoplanes ianthinogenes]|uniref:Uncharacterized protein n=1 Tax=Actinoplanes ianthinogenes TaxID=122358 RepID=A0ABM7M169_9ACTN|nr:hypothetical protein [Actinoplanes ianthinogenes]BCJ45356.1 hypothetical protein Aiant_60130 [Actinoplanes ianthinogenes]GGR53983.1 hypothetical protein GCM10010168_86250 [Actinoplanes ianthinogenes]
MTAPTKTAAEIIRWENPPPSRRNPGGVVGSRWDEVAEQLRDERGRWAVVYEGDANNASSAASIIRMGNVACFRPTGDFEAVSRRSPSTGRTTVYARYLGDGGGR